MRRSTSGRSAGAIALFGVAILESVVGCTYDFDRFTEAGDAGGAGAGGAPAAGSTSKGGSAGNAGRGGASSGGTSAGGSSTGGVDGEGGEAGSGNGGTGEPSGGAPDGGVGGEASGTGGSVPMGGSPEIGGEGGVGGEGTGGKATGGAPTGGAPTGGAPSGGAPTGGMAGGSGDDCTDRGGTLFGEHCYFVTGEALGWEAAATACADAAPGAHLVTITTAEEQEMVEDSFFATSSEYWIGLSIEDLSTDPPVACRDDPSTCPFLWVTAEELDFSVWEQRLGSDDEPNYTGACVRIQDNLEWADQLCATALLAICEEE